MGLFHAVGPHCPHRLAPNVPCFPHHLDPIALAAKKLSLSLSSVSLSLQPVNSVLKFATWPIDGKKP
eukprot:3405379-Amphidinium_carterae.1